MSEELFNQLVAPEDGSEPEPEQPPVEGGSEPEPEQPNPEEQVAEPGDGDEIDPEVNATFDWMEKEKVSIVDLRKNHESYKEAQRKITEQGQRLAMLEQQLAAKQGAPATAGMPDLPESVADEYFDKIEAVRDKLADPDLDDSERGKLKAEIRKLESARFNAHVQHAAKEQREFETYSESTMKAAIEAVGSDPDYGELPPEALEIAEKLMEDPVVKHMFESINVNNFRGYTPEIAVAHNKWLLSTVHDIALGRASKKLVHNTKVDAHRKEKEAYLKKGGLKVQGAAAAPKPAAKPTAAGDIMDRLDNFK